MTAMPIPEWLQHEVSEYFVEPLDITPATVLDIGANIGAFALHAHRKWPQSRIICFEPMPFNVEQLRQNVSEEWCQVVPCAVRARSGAADIYLGDMFVTGGFVKGERQTDRVIRVNCVAASEIPSCNLVKIDTEGSEVEILANLDLSETQVIMLEYHSSDDAMAIKKMLMPEFTVVRDQSDQAIGTMVFARA